MSTSAVLLFWLLSAFLCSALPADVEQSLQIKTAVAEEDTLKFEVLTNIADPLPIKRESLTNMHEDEYDMDVAEVNVFRPLFRYRYIAKRGRSG